MEKLYKIERPNLENIKLDQALFSEFFKPEIQAAVRKTTAPEYLHWKDIKYKNWIPQQFKNHREKFWLLVKFSRHV